MASVGFWVFATVFYILPLLLVLLTVLLWDANLFALILLFTWMGLGFLFNAAVVPEATS